MSSVCPNVHTWLRVRISVHACIAHGYSQCTHLVRTAIPSARICGRWHVQTQSLLHAPVYVFSVSTFLMDSLLVIISCEHTHHSHNTRPQPSSHPPVRTSKYASHNALYTTLLVGHPILIFLSQYLHCREPRFPTKEIVITFGRPGIKRSNYKNNEKIHLLNEDCKFFHMLLKKSFLCIHMLTRDIITTMNDYFCVNYFIIIQQWKIPSSW